ncbi:retrovirus-related pol polyprotein from transposon TNT 1-94, partial [Tanacetum coccineum]
LLNAASIIATLIDVNAAQSKLVLLENFNENYSKCLRLLVKSQLLVHITTASTKVTTASTKLMLLKELMLLVKKLAPLKVIENGATLPKTQVVEGVTTVMPITSAEDKAHRRLEVKARSTLMMGIPNKHQLNFNSIKDAKLLLQKLVSQLELLDEKILQEDVNTKLLRSLSPEWNTHALVQPNSPQLAHEDLQQIHTNDIEEKDLRWQMTMLTMRARRFLKNTGRKLTVNGNETIGFYKSKVECYNCHKRGHFARECGDSQEIKTTRRNSEGLCLGNIYFHRLWCHGGYDWSDQVEEGPNYALMAYSSSSSDSEVSNDSSCSKSCMETVILLKI